MTVFGRVAIAGLALAAGCSHPAARQQQLTIVFRSGARSLVLVVEVAATDDARRRGLMGRRDVPRGTGMLFRYPKAGAWGGYWMKDTLVPLDIAFIREGRVNEIDLMTPCFDDPCPLTTPAGPYDSAVEAAADSFSSSGITVGAQVSTSPR